MVCWGDMVELAAYSALAVTVGLVVARPRIGIPRIGLRLDVGPAAAAAVGVAILWSIGLVDGRALERALSTLWRPFVTISAIMVTTSVATRLGVIEAIAARVEHAARGSTARLFTGFFVLGALTAALLNNDSAILLLTPVVVATARRRFGGDPERLLCFAFAPFMAAGVAPLSVSNPMNMIVAETWGIDFNEYARQMLPIALAGWTATYLILRVVFRRALAAPPPANLVTPPRAVPLTTTQRRALATLLLVLAAYPAACALAIPVWPVAAAGAVLALAVMRNAPGIDPAEVVVRGVSWQVLAFLLEVALIAAGLENAGLVARLGRVYTDASVFTIGGAAAAGSALLNNHPMSMINLLALRATPGAGAREILAALIGGDLGPRLLPIGSLAGLLWLDCLRKQGERVPLGRFVALGLCTTIPTLLVSLALLGAG